ncbi:ATP-binding cassette domain-containing protein [Mesorhizobium sp. BH1-1-5]|uniref:ATP-binding cassette domain-containing protein n=1 Tax=unclassified Mesorhizobium TaxID=325217 RepID=UPI001128A693|nr:MULTISPECIES: ATP-binding cassette domain-containing protein [unclassified Mesorhizobium]MBZ9985495.1 ATP-binding cassette domain-containing protein [Mesorhizobium sp. BH1-1-5]TPJ60966.1 sugar ABC transporter ATP-binding protein [Mesorhizobium sp. B2-7-1]
MTIEPASDHGAAVAPVERKMLEVRNVHKHFGSVVALDGVSISVEEGKVAAIVGDNGAGKSTLVKILTGVHQPTSGEIFFDGQPTLLRSPDDARRAGVETLFQDLALVDDLTIWQNLFLGRELTWGGPLRITRKRAMAAQARTMLAGLQINIPTINARVRQLSGGQRQAVAISRAVGWNAKLTIMDEPTAALGVRERLEVESLIDRLRQQGRTFLLISHNFDQVMRLSNEIWIMRNGHVVGHRRTSETSGEELVALITGAKS